MKKKLVFYMICAGLFLFFFNTPVQTYLIAGSNSEVDLSRAAPDNIVDRLDAKGGPAALIWLTNDDAWFKNNKGSFEAKGLNTRQVKPDQYGNVLKELKEFYQRSSKYPLHPDRNTLYVYPVSSHRFADKDFLELIAYHNFVLYLEGTDRLYSDDSARSQLLMKIAKEINNPGSETGILNFVNWFNFLYKNYDGVIPASFTLFVPSKRQDGSGISQEEIDQVKTDFYNKIVSRFADGFTVFNAAGSWVLSTGELQEEDVQVATVDSALDKTQIFATTLLLIAQALEVRIQLDQDSVLVKVLNFPFFIGN
ncbi:MAG: DUF3574 domain-containing protein [bacterium]|nr:DUF3574 domain-containing protein [bacterium]